MGAPVERATVALEALRERIAGGLSPLVNVLNRGNPVDPDLVLPPSLAAYREFVAGLKERKLDDWAEEAEHYRRAARLDSTFVAPLIQLAYRAIAERRMLDHRFDRRACSSLAGTRLSLWNRLTIDLLRARCRGEMAEAVATARAAV